MIGWLLDTALKRWGERLSVPWSAELSDSICDLQLGGVL